MPKDKYGFEENPIQIKIRKIKSELQLFYYNKVGWKLREFQCSFIHHVKCFAVFWKLPNAIHGMEQLLLAETLEHQDTKDALDTASRRLAGVLEDVIELGWSIEENDIEAVKRFYKRHEMAVPDKYLTNDEMWDRAEEAHESYLGSGGIPDDAEIVDARYEGRKLLGIKSEMVLIDTDPIIGKLPNHLITWEEKLTTKKGGWNVRR